MTSGPTGWSRSSIAVTTPKLPPPPRSAQNSSGCSSADARIGSPLAAISSTARMLSTVRPCLRSSQPEPPPSASPATPVLDTRPPTVASPCSWVAASTSPQVRPPPTRTTRRSGSTTSSRRPRTSITRPSSTSDAPATEWPPPRTATRMPRVRANASAALTWWGWETRATWRGRVSTIALKSVRASSYSGSPGS